MPNGAPAMPGGEVQNVGKQQPLSNNNSSPTKSSGGGGSKGVTNLILLIEQGQWNAASQRAISHPHEVRQLVKLRKTTKNAPPSEASPNTTGGGASVQISNVKCKALHHACQKLRSVHTTIYQKKMTPHFHEGQQQQQRKVIEEDEYIEACKCILTLIRLHPEACKERESRHGCLPLHLCVFSMCATPPPPPVASNVVPSTPKGGIQPSSPHSAGATTAAGMTKSITDFMFGTSSSSPTTNTARPPPISNRAKSTPTSSNTIPAALPQIHTRDSSADFSVGNISTMIQEESEHQQKLEDHHRKFQKSNGGGNEEDMEQLLHSFDSIESEEKKKKKKSTLKKKVGLGSSTSFPSALGTLVVGALTPLDSLEEKSRETDSYSTPNVAAARGGGREGMEANTTLHPLMRPPSTMASLRQYLPSPDSMGGGGSFDKSDDGSTRSGGTATSSGSSSNANTVPQAPSANAAAAAIPPTHEELQRRYLQINTRRRDEFSIRVIDALLDAWPRGPKTASEGGRLPLHMACFGKATQRVLETILRSYPDGARQRNADGFLPIHIAAHWGVSHPDVAPLLLRAYPDGAVGRNRWERTPIEEALGMAGENGREHQMSLVWSLRRHPTYWIHNDIAMMLLPRNVRNAPWRIADLGSGKDTGSRSSTARRIGGRNGSSAVDVDEVGSSDEEEEGIEVQMPNSPGNQNPKQIKALAESTDLSLLIARDKHWEAAALRCRLCPNEAGEALEVKVRGAYTAKITPLLFACEHNPSVELIKALIKANPASLKRRQDPGGQLPIHAACTWGASSGVIDTLLSTDSSMAEEQDFLSNLPLHCACYSGAETSVVRALLRVHPQSVWTRNHQGSSAVDIVKRLSHSNRREVLGLLDMTMKNLLEKKKETKKGGEEGVEVDKDNSLMWV